MVESEWERVMMGLSDEAGARKGTGNRKLSLGTFNFQVEVFLVSTLLPSVASYASVVSEVGIVPRQYRTERRFPFQTESESFSSLA